MNERIVTVVESGNDSFSQFITAGTHGMGADEPSEFGGKRIVREIRREILIFLFEISSNPSCIETGIRVVRDRWL